jgi:UDP-2-acetamido-3-amino-2,3-dideoxy-glucuronate N-acetyltransferase
MSLIVLNKTVEMKTPLDYSVHEWGICESTHVGAGTKIWAFAHVLPGARIGANCNVCDGVFIENDVVVGDDVTIKCGVQLWDGVRVGNGVFIGPNATFTNDKYPHSKQYPEAFLKTVLEDGVSIGANATILPGVTIGAGAAIGAGSVVTKNVPPNATVIGNPAVIIGYQTAEDIRPTTSGAASRNKALDIGVGGCELLEWSTHSDMRGSLSAIEFSTLPFKPERAFMVFDVPNNKVRGEHAHRACHQFLYAMAGALSVVVDDGNTRSEVILDKPGLGLHIPPMVWGIQYKFQPGTILQVFASLPYDNHDYIRDYAEFLQLAASKSS